MAAQDRLSAAISARVARVHATGQARTLGHASTATWLRMAGGMSARAAAQTVSRATELARLSDLRLRFSDGRLTQGLVTAICSATAPLTDEQARLAEPILLELAQRAGPAQIAAAGRYLQAALSPDGESPHANTDYDQRYLVVRATESGGIEGDFRLPPEPAARLRALLNAYAKPRAHSDDRPLRTRNADAFIALLERQVSTELLIMVNAESLPDNPTPTENRQPTDVRNLRTEPGPADPDAEPQTTDLHRSDLRAAQQPNNRRSARRPTCHTVPHQITPCVPSTACGVEPSPVPHHFASNKLHLEPTATAGTPLSDTSLPDAARPDPDPPDPRAKWTEIVAGRGDTHTLVSGHSGNLDPRDDSRDGAASVHLGSHTSGADKDEMTFVRGGFDANASEHGRHCAPTGESCRLCTPHSRLGKDRTRNRHVPDAAKRPLTSDIAAEGACGRCGHVPNRNLPGLLLPTGHLLPVSDVHRLARTSTLVRIVIDADSQVLDMGREVRLATPAQRRAVQARYATCWVDGCPLPTPLCQIDHADGWIDNGPTDLTNLGPACQFHNRDRYRHPERYQRRRTGTDRWAYTYIAAYTRPHTTTKPPTPE
ncbi:HNH endonuclease [Streptosporangium sp. KLBMP 9127]|nr:HNH endonuclease [Streptosporangium sp. KLBMP 9127]